MLFHNLNGDGCPNGNAGITRGDYKEWDLYLHSDPAKTLIAFELNANGQPVPITDCDVQGKFYASGDYVDLQTGHDLSTAPSTYERYKVRITAHPGTSVVDKHIRFTMVTTTTALAFQSDAFQTNAFGAG